MRFLGAYVRTGILEGTHLLISSAPTKRSQIDLVVALSYIR